MIPGIIASADSSPPAPNVVALLHFDGPDGSTSFIDEKGNIFTGSGNTRLDTSEYKFGTASAYFDGTGDISSASAASFGFGTGDWSVSAYVRRNAAAAQVVWDNRSSGSGGQAMTTFFDASGFISYYDTSTKTGSIAVALNTWTKVEWRRIGGTVEMLVEDVVAFTGSLTADMGSSRPMRIGRDVGGGAAFTGWIDEFVVTKGYS